MKKILKIFSVVLAIILLVTSLTSCGGDKVKKNDIIGQWYSESGEMEIDVRKDGTYDDDGYGTGTWKYLDDGVTVEFTDFYGYTKTTTVIKDDYGYSIYNGRYYRDAYPSLEGETNEIPTNEIPTNDYNNQQTTGTQKIYIDAFTGIKYEVTGISPYCEISINNSGCSADAQERVTYTLDKEYYANGETATITATIASYKAKDGNNEYVLKNEQSTYIVSSQPEYVMSLNGLDLTELKQELDDYVSGELATSQKNATEGGGFADVLGTYMVHFHNAKINELTCNLKYFSCLKMNKEVSDTDFYNKLSFVYTIKYTCTSGSGILYSVVSAIDIVKYPDGTLKWGTESADMKDFIAEGATGGVKNAVTMKIMCNSANYNISKVEI